MQSRASQVYVKPTEIPWHTFWIARQTQFFPEITALPSILMFGCKTLQHCIPRAAAKNEEFCTIPAMCSNLLSLLAHLTTQKVRSASEYQSILGTGSIFCWTSKLIQINYTVTPWVDTMERSCKGDNKREWRWGRQIPPSMTAKRSHSA